MFNAFLVEIDQLPNLSHLSFFYKMEPVFFYKIYTKIGVFYKYGYTDITETKDPYLNLLGLAPLIFLSVGVNPGIEELRGASLST